MTEAFALLAVVFGPWMVYLWLRVRDLEERLRSLEDKDGDECE